MPRNVDASDHRLISPFSMGCLYTLGNSSCIRKEVPPFWCKERKVEISKESNGIRFNEQVGCLWQS